MENQPILLNIENVSKRFPGVQALDQVSLQVFKGEVHAIVGENGAGKSTLMNILSGVYDRDSGEIYFKEELFRKADPAYCQEIGLATVYQELTLAPNMTVADNIYLWNLPKDNFGLVKRDELVERARNLLQSLGMEINPEQKVGSLSVCQQQIVEIAKALSRNASLIIMDEPNSALSPSETKLLFSIINRLKTKGVTILFISHRLDEVFEIADRITVMRDGKLIATNIKDELTIEKVVNMMVGREMAKGLRVRTHFDRENDGDPILSVRNLSDGREFRDISFELHQHEIVGLAGLLGAGRTAVAETLFGLRPTVEGEVFIGGKKETIHSPADAVKLGIGFVSEDRKASGLFIKMAVQDNINMNHLDQLSRFGMLNMKYARDFAIQMVESLDIRTKSIFQKVSTLSGGNQQKAIIGRWLAVSPKILILDEPTRGIDVGAKAQMYELINDLAKQGMAILLISSEIEEILALSDRIIVMRRGQKRGTLDFKEATSEKIMLQAA